MFLTVLTTHKAANLTNEGIMENMDGSNSGHAFFPGQNQQYLTLCYLKFFRRTSLILFYDDYIFQINPEDVQFKVILTHFH